MEEIVPLIHRAQAGDAEAYGELVSRFQDMAYGYAYAILSDFHLAQDAAQEAFIEAYQCLPSLREVYAFPAWLKRIVHKHCDRLTRRKRLATAPLDAAGEVASWQPGPVEIAERHDLAQRVQNAIRELPDTQRVVTTLFYINGYSHQDIADFLEVPAKTVKSRLHASRSRLRERMIDMVEDELKSNKLPEEFTQKTVEQAVASAKELNKDSKYNEAEELLRQVLPQAPENPDLLRELNHAIARRVYSQGRFDLLPELARYGKTILQTVEDDYIYAQLARTLLTIPAMPEAVAFITDWIAKKGPNIERVGMLAWAKGCVADYDAAESLWQEVLALARNAEPDEILGHLPFIAYTMVDCLAAAEERPRAQRVAQQAWNRCCEVGQGRKLNWFNADGDWMTMFQLAGLDFHEVVQVLQEQDQTDTGLKARGERVCLRGWVDDLEAVADQWLEWVGECVAAGEWCMPKNFFWAARRGLHAREYWRSVGPLADATWNLLQQADVPEVEEQASFWECQSYFVWPAILARDWDAIETIIAHKMAKDGISGVVFPLICMATIRGTVTPPEAMQHIEQMDADRRDLWDWYVIAREAAAAGEHTKAFDALRKAMSYWTNGIFYAANEWEKDEYWGELRNHPEFKAVFDERRKRVGPIYGLLHYFPGWYNA